MNTKIIPTIFGAASFLFPYLLVAQATKQTYCSIFDQPRNSIGQVVKTKALMTYSTISRVDGGDTFIYSQDCNNNDYFSTIDFPKLKNLRKWNKFFEKLPSEKNFIFEIDFTGRLQFSITPRYGHLSWSLAEMEMLEIFSIKDVTSVSAIRKPDEKADAPLKAKGASLQIINTELLYHLILGERKFSLPNIEQYISDDFPLIDKLERKFNKKDYRKLTKKGLFRITDNSTISIGSGEAGKIKDGIYTVSGKIGASLKGEKEEALNYRNTFRFSEVGGWTLLQTELFEN